MDLNLLKLADANYKGIFVFKEWSSDCIVADIEVRMYSRFLKQNQNNPSIQTRARNIVKRTAAIETGAIEHLYDVDRGFTFTVATEGAMWEAALNSKGEKTRSLIEAQLGAYDFVLDLVTKSTPVTEAWIRQLHTELCKSQETYSAYTEIGRQELRLPLGKYKALPNHVLKQDQQIHSYAPVELVPEEMHRLVTEINSPEFNSASAILQAAYVHHCLTVIHPFADGNGRVARALASVFTYRTETVPMLVFAEARPNYFAALESADIGKHQLFVDFVTDNLLDALRLFRESMITASVPSVEEIKDQVEHSLTPQSGHTYQQLRDAGIRLINKLWEELRGKVAMAKLSDGRARVSFPNINPDGRPKLKIQANYVTGEPYSVQSIQIISISIPTDPSMTDEFAISVIGENVKTNLEFRTRVSDVFPDLRATLNMRLSMFAERVLSLGLTDLKSKIDAAKKAAKAKDLSDNQV